MGQCDKFEEVQIGNDRYVQFLFDKMFKLDDVKLGAVLKRYVLRHVKFLVIEYCSLITMKLF